MKLKIYKGFNEEFLSQINIEPLIDNDYGEKLNVLGFNKGIRKKLQLSLLSMEEDDEAWITYEEYSLIKTVIEAAVEEDDLKLVIYRNNTYPDYYPINFKIDEELIQEIIDNINGTSSNKPSENCEKFLAVFNSLIIIDKKAYVSFYNFEYEPNKNIQTKDYYPYNIKIEDTYEECDYHVFLNDDIETYLKDLINIQEKQPNSIGLFSSNSASAKRVQYTLQAYCQKNNVKLYNFHERLKDNIIIEEELKDIAKNVLNIEGFSDFRTIKFYKNPDINKDVIELSQSVIIQEIIAQAERAYNQNDSLKYRDIFITASTGAGKSVMFQIPAIYLAKKYNKLTIIIEPVKALMQDQKEKMNNNGFFRVETFNSDLITQVEKENVLNKIKEGKVDLLYLSPETLLSYSIETIIGGRDLGLIIIDEAHIVTTWGIGFRPDYWYLGAYIYKLRNESVYGGNRGKRKTYSFPICAFTATAINGGIDDSVSDTIISLYMENPIKYIGYIRRDDISFEISQKSQIKLPKSKYEEAKTIDLNKRLLQWLDDGTKTIVYFPYASMVGDAVKGVRAFAGITCSQKIGTYSGRNIDSLSVEMFNEQKRETFKKFKDGEISIIYATKAFGMGVDVDDVEVVYHYAVTGNLCDYIQEIGRAARKSTINGCAVIDNYYNNISYMQRLFGMSQIRQYQIKKVLQGVYNTYKGKNHSRNFLISPESFTYIFNGKGVQNESECINKLKTCLMMLEKDFYDKFNFKVLIARPQSIFTKAYVVIIKDDEKRVFLSKYRKCFEFIESGRIDENQGNGSLVSDMGDIYSIDLKKIWEDFHQKLSFPQFKYWFFNNNSDAKDKVEIMPEIRKSFAPRQKITIEVKGDFLLNEIRNEILNEFEYIADTLYSKFGKSYFTHDDFIKAINQRYGMTKSRIIVNSLFDLVDPNGYCIKTRVRGTSTKTEFSLSNGNFKELMRRPIIQSSIIGKISLIEGTSYSSFLSLTTDEKSNVALKLLSIFDYITYEVLGGSEPEIFIRLNDPNKVKDIVMGNIPYSNSYVSKAKQKHDRDVDVLLKFFNEIDSDNERWNYVENYFLGHDVLAKAEKTKATIVPLSKFIDKEHSYSTTQFNKWNDMKVFFDEADHKIIDKLASLNIHLPDYLETVLKNMPECEGLIMCWSDKNTIICQQDVSDKVIEKLKLKGWNVFKFYDIDYERITAEVS